MILSLAKPAISVASRGPKKNLKRAKAVRNLSDLYLDAGLLDLVRLRLAQIHGCKRCIRKYTNKLKANGETAERLQRLERWRRETVFSLKEKVALNLVEAVTHNPLSSVSTTAIRAASLFFIEEEMILLALDITAITDRHYLKTFQHDI